MVVIRLRKPGKAVKGRRHFKIVVDEKNSKIDGRFIQQIGYYDPSKQPVLLKMDIEAYEKWVGNGAQPSDTVASLFKKFKKYPDGNIPEKAGKVKQPEPVVEEKVKQSEPEPVVEEEKAEAPVVVEEAAPEAPEADATEEKTEA